MRVFDLVAPSLALAASTLAIPLPRPTLSPFFGTGPALSEPTVAAANTRNTLIEDLSRPVHDADVQSENPTPSSLARRKEQGHFQDWLHKTIDDINKIWEKMKKWGHDTFDDDDSDDSDEDD